MANKTAIHNYSVGTQEAKGDGLNKNWPIQKLNLLIDIRVLSPAHEFISSPTMNKAKNKTEALKIQKCLVWLYKAKQFYQKRISDNLNLQILIFISHLNQIRNQEE